MAFELLRPCAFLPVKWIDSALLLPNEMAVTLWSPWLWHNMRNEDSVLGHSTLCCLWRCSTSHSLAVADLDWVTLWHCHAPCHSLNIPPCLVTVKLLCVELWSVPIPNKLSLTKRFYLFAATLCMLYCFLHCIVDAPSKAGLGSPTGLLVTAPSIDHRPVPAVATHSWTKWTVWSHVTMPTANLIKDLYPLYYQTPSTMLLGQKLGSRSGLVTTTI